jgi:hypothetical protein
MTEILKLPEAKEALRLAILYAKIQIYGGAIAFIMLLIFAVYYRKEIKALIKDMFWGI